MESVNQPLEETVLKKGKTFYNSGMVKRGFRVMDAYFTEKFILPERAPQAKKKQRRLVNYFSATIALSGMLKVIFSGIFSCNLMSVKRTVRVISPNLPSL